MKFDHKTSKFNKKYHFIMIDKKCPEILLDWELTALSCMHEYVCKVAWRDRKITEGNYNIERIVYLFGDCWYIVLVYD